MKALILCGGYGTRLKPLTWFTPKPMIKVNGKPVLEYIVEHLNSFGITDITVNMHYKPWVFVKYFGTRLHYSWEFNLKGEEGTIQSLKHWFGNNYVVVQNGDTLTDVDISQMMRVSKGRNIRYMDGDTYAGVRIIRPGYREGDPSSNYYDKEASWVDMGTFKGLRRAKEYVQKLDNLRQLRDQRN